MKSLNYTNLRRRLPTQTWLPSGRSRDMKTSAAFVASRWPLSIIVETIFFFADPRHELCDELHLPSAEEQVGGGQDCRVRPLRMSGMFRIILVLKIVFSSIIIFAVGDLVANLQLSSLLLSRLFWASPNHVGPMLCPLISSQKLEDRSKWCTQSH